MRPDVKRVKNYWKAQFIGLNIDTDVLSDCVQALTIEEHALLMLWNPVEEPSDDVKFVLSKVFNRHNDVCGGATSIVNDRGVYVVEITSASSISELDIDYNTLRSCNKQCIYHIDDVITDKLPTLPLEVIADVTRAIIVASNADDGTRRRGQCVIVQTDDSEAAQGSGECLAKE